MINHETVSRNQDEYLHFLSRLVQMDTQVIEQGIDGGNEAAGQQIIKEKLLDLGFNLDEFEVEDEKIKNYPGANLGHKNSKRPNVVGALKGTGGGKSLILNGHIDTMPFGDRNSWKRDPFSGSIEDNFLYGLGATDMKGSLSAMIMAAQLLQSLGVRLKGDLIIESVVDEEGGGNGTLACVDRGYQADGAIVGEPTQLHIQPSHMGFLFHEINVTGKSLHSSQLWNGVNAIDKGIKIYHALKEMEHEWLMTEKHPLLPGPTLNLGMIEGGIAGSVVPESCTLRTCLHYQPRVDQPSQQRREAVNNQVLGCIERVSRSDKWLTEHPPKVNVYQEGFPFETSVHHPLVQDIKSVLEDHLSEDEVVVEGMPAGCDARLLSGFGHTPTIILGCGDAKDCHQPNESVSVPQYLKLIEIYAGLIMQWCGVDAVS